jgi:hypothetical protein
MMEQLDAPPAFFGVDLRNELERLAHAGPREAPALEAIRAVLAVPEKKLGAIGVHEAAAHALAFVGRDRASLPVLRKGYSAFFADSTAAFGGMGELSAQAVLNVEPDDPKARRALRLEPGPLLYVLTRKAIQGERLAWWIEILLLREQDASPPWPPARRP